ncbi:Excinuclease ABC subunit C (UvrC) [Prochlorococcus marinus subsp. pastoris str. CCMP1986]|uniref:UvrABC system protein C n=1 Tax=Prochlorococcus marinus subsp. pastoris (strain CCMP1986 / NIES-2087 / MED4) TaxID=59919 RepID=UVRC_PROMP|nr:excinuclease ABC subunit UvrC [Prochlorococcus marinus]Q7V1I9.1 RecName: Full=UvrABC system protein C; Short=Protein UvrC; AltName: Full=Excinuclease ABC subunit C [Prochlorococcus marinus subsp. pastoris str. CCMP1986]KGF87554.1 Excinuclease ABC subunit C [Prochlorococcus marinus str. EQPAC1]CAE19341.1 Excinuclease ABC subunit C (UvrC) [Prochlorococcus marinus subsp. pastoris str. CCMP1986]
MINPSTKVSTKVLDKKYNFKIEYKLIKNKDLLKSRLSEIPKSSGCYLFKDIDNNLLYIGKSKTLRNRVSSYFNNYAELSPRLSLMVRQITEIEIIVTDSEYEALNLESNLIKTNKPYFNILLKDDKKYPYLCITWSEQYPRIFITRKRRNRNNFDRYYGPYVDVGLLRKTLFIIKKIFPLRQRPRPVYKDRTCLNYSIGRCPGVCQEIISSEDYKKTMKQVSMIFQGRNDDLEVFLERKMNQYSNDLEFENAAKIRDQISGLKLLTESQKISIPDSSINRDIFGIVSENNISSIQIFQMRSGKLIGRIGYTQKIDNSDETEILQRVLEEHYINVEGVEIPSEILLQFNLPKHNTIEEWLSELRQKKVKLIIPKRNKKFETVEMVLKNAKLELERILNGIQDNESSIEDLTQILELTNQPRRIEGYDISHIQGTDPVASQVVFIDGIPSKQNYRKYKIKDPNIFIGHSDDFASIYEVIYRRFKKWSKFKIDGGDISSLQDKKKSTLENDLLTDWPDLIMIDGGKGQLNAALKALTQLDLHEEVNICSLAKKNEEIFIPGFSKSLDTDQNQKGLLLLRRVRDEAHRFALSFHRNKRSARMNRSQLSQIPGLGPSRIKDLLEHFNSIDAIRIASREELSKVKGLGMHSANDIYNYFNEL